MLDLSTQSTFCVSLSKIVKIGLILVETPGLRDKNSRSQAGGLTERLQDFLN